MAIPIWPTTLPQKPLYSGYTEQYPDNLLRSEVESGVQKVRPKGAQPPFVIQVSLRLTPAQRSAFNTFVWTTLNQGALRFSWTHPIDGTSIEARIKPQQNALYTMKKAGLKYNTVLLLEIMP